MPKENILLRTERIGLLGGTFNPIHEGHIVMAQEAQKSLELDRIYFIPNYCNPDKRHSPPAASIGQRLYMLELALSPYQDFYISLAESAPRLHYTYQTIRYFRRYFPSDYLVFIAGEDILDGLCYWEEFSSFIHDMDFFIFPRKDTPFQLPTSLLDYKDHLIISPFIPPRISSSEIRAWSALHPGAKNPLVLPEISDYVSSMKLYEGA